MSKIQYCHYPKSAGRMVERMLKKKYGINYLRVDGNFISETPEKKGKVELYKQYLKTFCIYFTRKQVCIGGHMPPLKFASWKATFIREPVGRIYSEYQFFKRKNPEFIGERSFLQYAEEAKRTMVSYSDFYLKNTFQFMGFFDQLQLDAQRFAKILGVNFEGLVVNATDYPEIMQSDRIAAEQLFQEDILAYDAVSSIYKVVTRDT